MNRKELATAIAADLETDRKSAEEFLGSFIDVVTTTVAKGEPITQDISTLENPQILDQLKENL